MGRGLEKGTKQWGREGVVLHTYGTHFLWLQRRVPTVSYRCLPSHICLRHSPSAEMLGTCIRKQTNTQKMAFLPLSLPCRVPFPLLRPVIKSSSCWCSWCLHLRLVHSPYLGLPLSPGQEVLEERDPRISYMVQWHYESWFSSLVLLLPLLFRTESHSTQGS